MTTPGDTNDSIPPDEVIRLLIDIPRTAREADIVITPREAVLFLSMSAVEYWATPCDEPHCEVCYDFVSSWKSIYQALDALDRASVEGALEHYDTRAPDYPKGLR